MIKRYITCPLCEALCGLEVTLEGGRIAEIRGDAADVLSRGFLCPKAMALRDFSQDPERLRAPMIREGTHWKAVSWEKAIRVAAERLASIQKCHGLDSIAFYTGNPNLHSYSAQLLELEFAKVLRTRNLYSTASVDHLPHLFASYHMFGHQLLLPVPDIERTDCFLIFGANPAESNGSLMTAPGMPRRIAEIRARGGQVLVFDPRRTLTAELASRYYAIRPGTDALLLLALIRTLFAEGLVRPGRLASFTDGIVALEQISRPFIPEKVAPITAIPATEIHTIASTLAETPSAVCYGRVGVCTQEFGSTCQWLINALNILTGNFDRPGGAMLPRPAVDIVAVSSLLGQRGSYARWHSRVRGLPEFAGLLPLATLAEEIATPGRGQIRGLITSAGNPVLSAPNGAGLRSALRKLEFMVALDLYKNETTSHADIILPPTSALERDHYDVVFRAFGVRNTTRYSLSLLDAAPGQPHDWQIYCRLGAQLAWHRGDYQAAAGWLRLKLLEAITPRRVLSLLLRFGPYGAGLPWWRRGVTLADLTAAEHTHELGPLVPCLPGRLYTSGKRIQAAPAVLRSDLPRLEAMLGQSRSSDALTLIGRRQLRANNSWMHRFTHLRTSQNRCTLLMNPADASERGISGGDIVEVRGRSGKIQVTVELSSGILRGVVSLPHGFSDSARHSQSPAPWSGASLNDITDELRLDSLSGTAALSGVPVSVLKIRKSVVPGQTPEEQLQDNAEQSCRHF